MGVNLGTCPVGSDSVWNAYGVTRNSGGYGYCEMSASFMDLLLVNLPNTELLRTSSCGTRVKVSAGELNRRSSRLGNGISFVYP